MTLREIIDGLRHDYEHERLRREWQGVPRLFDCDQCDGDSEPAAIVAFFGPIILLCPQCRGHGVVPHSHYKEHRCEAKARLKARAEQWIKEKRKC